MAGTFVGVAGVQQFQLIGANPAYGSRPMRGGSLTVYNANTTTLTSTFQDIGLAVPAQNPLPLDDTGRIPQFYVADGYYRLVLADASGVTSNGGFNYPSVPSIGPSSSGGGGSGVDPTTILSTGDIKWQPIQGTLTGFVRLNGRTIGSSSSGASERANTDCQSLFLWIWNNISDGPAPVVGGRGASASADWAANKQITLIDMRARAPIGLDDMGNSAAGRLTSVSTPTPTTPGSSLGLDSVSLVARQNGPHNHSGQTGVDAPDHAHNVPNREGVLVAIGGAASDSGPLTGSRSTSGATARHAHPIQLDGSGVAHQNMPPAVLGTFFQKL